jgi:2-polyprenyl-3-methyl-5-hydroxy-6-metoxy-1,4-benzoquinol methylase
MNTLKAIQEQLLKIEQDVANIKVAIRNLSEFEQLSAMLESDAWPAATTDDIEIEISSEQEKEDRAEGILSIIVNTNLTGLKLLDFGCGEGYVVHKARSQKPKLSIGYDIVAYPKWNDFAEDKLTSNWTDVANNKPYDIILVYDVLDHITNESQVQVLKKLKQLLTSKGQIFIRLHPFCSRHATHLKLNKAFVHLVFNEYELEILNLTTSSQKIIKVINPTMTYNEMFTKAGLRIISHDISRRPVEPFFFNTPLVAKRIKAHWVDATVFPLTLLEQQFLDYTLM